MELWLLRGNTEEATAAGRGQRGGASSVAFYERALGVRPGHFAAHHYLVHSHEMLGRIEDALAHGEAYVRLAPAVPHAHHMWAHDLRRVGRTQDAIGEFRKALALENAYYAAEGIPAELDWHHQHNLDLLATSHQHQGQMREAEALMRRSFGMPPPYEYSAFNKKEWPAFLLGRGRHAEAREAAQGLVASRFAAARVLGHVTLAQLALAQGSPDVARAEEALAQRELAAVDLSPLATRNALVPYLDLVKGSLQLRAEPAAGRALLEDVGTRLRALPGPDAWMQALFVLESIARTAREAADWELAERMARQMLEHDRAYAGGHYALGLVAQQRGDAALAQEAFATAARLWDRADGDLPGQRRQRLRRDVAARVKAVMTGLPEAAGPRLRRGGADRPTSDAAGRTTVRRRAGVGSLRRPRAGRGAGRPILLRSGRRRPLGPVWFAGTTSAGARRPGRGPGEQGRARVPGSLSLLLRAHDGARDLRVVSRGRGARASRRPCSSRRRLVAPEGGGDENGLLERRSNDPSPGAGRQRRQRRQPGQRGRRGRGARPARRRETRPSSIRRRAGCSISGASAARSRPPTR